MVTHNGTFSIFQISIELMIRWSSSIEQDFMMTYMLLFEMDDHIIVTTLHLEDSLIPHLIHLSVSSEFILTFTLFL